MLAIFAMALRVSLDSDTWWHLAAGRWMVEHGSLLREDPFSFTRLGSPWHYPGWLAQLLFYGVYRVAGAGGLNVLVAAVVTLAFVFVYGAMRGDAFVRSFILLLAAIASAVYWSARPQILSLLLAAAFAWVLEDFRSRGRNRLWLLPPLMALWVNLHGGFAIGFIFIALSMIGSGVEGLLATGSERRRAWRASALLAGVGLVCAMAVGLNPFGYEMLVYPFKTIGIDALQAYIQEWQSPDFHTSEAQPFLWLLFVSVAAIGFSHRRLAAADFILFAGVAYIGFLAGRNMPLLAIVAPPIIARHAQEILERLAPSWGKGDPGRAGLPRMRWLNAAGLMLGAKALQNGETLRIAHLFAGFQEKKAVLLRVGWLNGLLGHASGAGPDAQFVQLGRLPHLGVAQVSGLRGRAHGLVRRRSAHPVSRRCAERAQLAGGSGAVAHRCGAARTQCTAGDVVAAARLANGGGGRDLGDPHSSRQLGCTQESIRAMSRPIQSQGVS